MISRKEKWQYPIVKPLPDCDRCIDTKCYSLLRRDTIQHSYFGNLFDLW